MKGKRERSVRFGSTVAAAARFLSVAFLFLPTAPHSQAATVGPEDPVAPNVVIEFNASPATLGSIPDHTGTCQTGPFVPRNVLFFTSGLGPTIQSVQLSMTFSPSHTFMGDITATLFAPNGQFHTIFGRTGATSLTGSGDSTDLAGPYVFRDDAVPPNGGWWQTSTLLGAGVPMTAGSYFTTNSGGAGSPNPQPATNMTDAFDNIPNPNGTWILRLTDGCMSDTGGISAASLTLATTGVFKSRADFDADGKTDLSVYRPGDGNWYLNRSTGGFLVQNWGLATDIPAPGDFDGDGRADFVQFRPSTGTWWILRSTGTFTSFQFGAFGDTPVTGDYNGDGLDDIAVYRPTTSVWYIQITGGPTGIHQFGTPGDLPVPGDYNADGFADIAIFRPLTGQWWIAPSNSAFITVVPFGVSTDKPVPADYDGDGKDDIAIYRPTGGQWWTLSSLNGAVSAIPFGNSTDTPVPGDYDGDGYYDRAIYRNGVWWTRRTASGAIGAAPFGTAADIPIPAQYIP